MNRRKRIIYALLAIGGWALLIWLAVLDWAGAASARVPTAHYQIDTGQHVYTWLDEPHGLLCVLVPDAGLSCLPLTASSYNWPILP